MLVVVDPRRGEVVEVRVEGAGDDPAMRFVGVEGAWVSGSQHQRRGGFPAVGEAVERLESFDAAVRAELGEEPAAADALQLSWIADEGQSPSVAVGQVDDVVQRGCRQHPGFVDDQRGAGRELVIEAWRPIGTPPFVEQLGDGVGRDPGVAFERPCRLGRRCDGEDALASMREIVAGGLRACASCRLRRARRRG